MNPIVAKFIDIFPTLFKIFQVLWNNKEERQKLKEMVEKANETKDTSDIESWLRNGL